MTPMDTPAILGGPAAVRTDATAATRWPRLDDADRAAVMRILDDGDISTHPVIGELEADYRTFTGMPYALAHCNGTAALLAAFWAIGLRPGDEVLVPTATFWASVLPMLWLGAVPVFCESEPEQMGIDPADMERKITARTKAVVVVHLWGLPARMDEIRAVAARHGLRLIEDASHAHGAAWRGQACGSLGDVAVFSLQGSKLAPAGEGGIFLCREPALWERAVCLGDIVRIARLESPARRFAATSFGIKTRIAPLSAAIARVQLARLEDGNRERARALVYLSEALESLGFNTFLPPPSVRRVYFEYLIRPRAGRCPLPLDLLLRALATEGCQVARPRYPLLHQQPFFTENAYREVLRLPDTLAQPDYSSIRLPVTEAVNAEMIKLPTFHLADFTLLDEYILAFEKVMQHAPQILAAG